MDPLPPITPPTPSPMPMAPPTARWGMLGAIIGAALVLGAVAYWGIHQAYDGSYVVPSFSPRPSTSAVPADWKTYRNEQYGFEVKYPTEYFDAQYFSNRGQVDVSMTSPNGAELHIAIETLDTQSCIDLLCNQPAQSRSVMNEISWDYLGMQNYCDAGHCSSERPVYRTVHGNSRLYFFFDKEPREHQILSTFKFASPSSSVPSDLKSFSSKYFNLSF